MPDKLSCPFHICVQCYFCTNPLNHRVKTKEEIFGKISDEYHDSEIAEELPLPLMYRLYRIYKELDNYSRSYIIPDYPSDPSSSKIAMEFTLAEDNDDELDLNEWAHVVVNTDGTWNTDGHFVNLPLDMSGDIDEAAEDEAMKIFVRDLPPVM